MKTEHEKLKDIADIIGYKIKNPFRISGGQDGNSIFIIRDNNLADVREIIFTQEFMDKFIAYRKNWNLQAYPYESLIGTFCRDLIGGVEGRGHLDNPVDYLINLLTK